MMSTAVQAALWLSDSVVLSIVVKATAVAAAALLVVMMGRRLRAAVRHVVLTAAACVLLALPALSAFGGSAAPVLPVDVGAVDWTLIADQPVSDPAGNTIPVAASSATGRTMWPVREVLFIGVWVAGAVVFLIPMAVGIGQLQRFRRAGVPMLPEQALARKLSAAAGIRRRVHVLSHESIAGPMTFGVVAPVVFLPHASRGWPRETLTRALVHELEHVRRLDWFVHCATRMVCALYWFHPLVWRRWRELCLEAERACDDRVVRDGHAAEYADQLVDMAEHLSIKGRPPLLAMAGRDDLRTRVAAILDPTVARGRAGFASVAFASVIAIAVGAFVPVRVVTLAMPHVTVASASAGQPTALVLPAMPSAEQMVAPRLTPVEQTSPAPRASTAAEPAFAVASVKINASGARGGGPQTGGNGAPPSVGGRFVRTNVPVDVLIATAMDRCSVSRSTACPTGREPPASTWRHGPMVIRRLLSST